MRIGKKSFKKKNEGAEADVVCLLLLTTLRAEKETKAKSLNCEKNFLENINLIVIINVK